MATGSERSRVLTLVFTDLADSTALKREKGDDAADALITRHRDHVVRLSDDCSGRVIDWAGDGCFLTFETSSAAVMFALRLQQAHSEETDLPGVRVGVHMGEVTEKIGHDGNTQIKGLAVDIAARVQSLAKPGQVLLSAAVYDSARQRIGVDALGQPVLWQTHGAYTLKGFDKPLDIGEAGLEGLSPLEAPEASEKAQPLVPVATPDVEVIPPGNPSKARNYAVIAMFFAAIIGVTLGTDYIAGLMTKDAVVTPNAAGGPITSIAVLPLDNLMNDPDQDYFADGMTEAITAELAKIKSIKVISRTSMMQYKDTIKTMPEIAGELGVEALIEGSVLRDGDDVRITVQLIDARTDTHLWAESYTNTITSVLKLQSDVALAIADEIRATLTPEERQRIEVAETVNPEAYDLYLRGLQGLTETSPLGMQHVRDLLTRATEMAPDFAPAWSVLAMSHIISANMGLGSPREHYETAYEASLRAVELDPDWSEAHADLGFLDFLREQDWDTAKSRLATAVALSPNSAGPHVVSSYFYTIIGQFDSAFYHARRSLELDPFSPEDASAACMLLAASGRPEEGLPLLNSLADRLPMDPQTHYMLSLAYIFASRFDEALPPAERFVALTANSPFAQANRATILALAGRENEAKALLQTLSESVPEELLAATTIAMAYARLGELDTAFEWLRMGAENPNTQYLTSFRLSPFIPGLLDEPNVMRFRADPRYWALIEEENFPPLPPEHPGYADEQAWLARKASAAAASAPIKKIAVLPFDNLMGDPEQEYFVDGMTETLIAQLVKIDGMRVISRTSAMRFKGSDESLPDIARKLGADALIEGSVLRAGNDVRITAQLIHGVTDEHLWANSYDGTLDNILSLQSEVAIAIANEIEVAVAPEEALRLLRQKPVDPEAQEAYLKGRYHFHKATRSDYATSIAYFTQAIELDPNFARAYDGLAHAYVDTAAWGFSPSAEMLAKSKEAALKAIALDETLAQPHDALSWIAFARDWDWETAEGEFRRSLELDPNDAFVRYNPTWLLSYFGRHEEAIAMIEKGLELDPLMLILHWTAGMAYNRAHQPEKAIQISEKALRLDPDFGPAHIELGAAYVQLGEYAKAVGILTRARELTEDSVYAIRWLVQAQVGAGNPDEARRLLQEALGDSNVETVYPALIASMHASLGNNDKAFEYLERAYEARDWWIIGIKTGPIWDSIRDDPRFQPLVDKLNLPEPPNDITAETRSTRS